MSGRVGTHSEKGNESLQDDVLFDSILQRDIIQRSQRLVVARLLKQRVQQRDFRCFGQGSVHVDLDGNEQAACVSVAMARASQAR